MSITLHHTVPLSCNILPDKEIWTGVIEGAYAEVVAEATHWIVGTKFDDAIRNPVCNDVQDYGVVTLCQVQRKEGGLAELHYGFTYPRKVEIWTCDMAEISKDIRTWLSSERGGMNEQEASTALAQIAQWEAYKDAGDYTNWQNFVYDNGKVLSGNALLLAHKIMKGISSYTIYAPVITKTSLWVDLPPLEDYGYIGTPTVRVGWSVLGGDVFADGWQWLKTGAKAQPNGDGTYTLVEQWIGADEIDGDLYPTVSGGNAQGA